MSKAIKCPKWGCSGIGIPADTKKKFSFGKALVGNTVGGLLGGPVGAVVGAATGIKGKMEKQNLCVLSAELYLKRKYKTESNNDRGAKAFLFSYKIFY